jgi:pyroglutamyl-peptidase
MNVRAHRTLLLTGFEPFLDVSVNPSGEVAQRLHGRMLGHASHPVEVVGTVLPVSFDRAPTAVSQAVADLGADPLAIVSLGVHRGPEFRLEAWAGTRYESAQADNDGVLGAAIQLAGPERLETPFDLTRCSAWLEASGAGATMISEDAGGYLCERVFRAGLEVPGAPALFLHVPPLEVMGVDAQSDVVIGFIEQLVAELAP